LEHNKPELAKQWHTTKNGNLTAKDVVTKARQSVWWQCDKGHEWKAAVYSRAAGAGCPYCAGKKVCVDNCLDNLNPALSKQWHPTKNGNLTPKDVTIMSGKKVWWLCDKGHEWEDTIDHRSSGRGCPYCSGQRVCKDNCLQTINPNLANEWHPTKNGDLTPKDVLPGSGKKVWWLCDKGHEWKAVIYSRKAGRGCPRCFGRKK
jgi:hypothetical protein